MVTVSWSEIEDSEDARWGFGGVLYAYLDPDNNEILYIGKADGTSTVASRFRAPDKDAFWEDLENEHDLTADGVVVVVGEVELPRDTRLTRQLLTDIESLLIFEEQPWGNVQNTQDRPTRRPGMVIRCEGTWPGRKLYRDR